MFAPDNVSQCSHFGKKNSSRNPNSKCFLLMATKKELILKPPPADNITGHVVTLRSCFEFSEVIVSIHHFFLLSHILQLGTLQWAVHFSPHLKDTTTHWVEGGKSGLVFTSLCAPPCGR